MWNQRLQLLKHGDWRVRKSTARGLVGVLKEQHVPQAIALLREEKNSDVVKWLGMAIARAGSLSAVKPLEAKLQEARNGNTLDWLLASIAVLEQPGDRALRDELLSSDQEVVRRSAIGSWAAHGLGADLVEVLTRRLDHPDPEVRRWATLALGHHGHVVVEPIIQNLFDSNVILREWTAHVLTGQNASLAREPLVSLMQDPHPRVREWAARAIASYRSPEDSKLLTSFYFLEKDEFVREAICLSLLTVPLHEETRSFLVKALLSDKSPILVGEVARAVLSDRQLSTDPALIQAVSAVVTRFARQPQLLSWISEPLRNFLSDAEQATITAIQQEPRLSLAVQLQACLAMTPESLRMNGVAEFEIPPKIAIVAALPEELITIVQTIESVVGPLTRDQDLNTGLPYYYCDHTLDTGTTVQLLFYLIGKGNEAAASRTTSLLINHFPTIVANIGIAASLSTDAKLCDVVAGSQIYSYLSNAKAVADGESFKFHQAGEPYRADSLLLAYFEDLKVSAASSLSKLTQEMAHAALEPLDSTIKNSLLDEKLIRTELKTMAAPIASGPAVAASTAFTKWLLDVKRDYTALDMESAGVATAAEVAGGLNRIRVIILRGISDYGDERKNQLEDVTNGAFRGIATEAALRVFLLLLSSLPRELLSR